MGEQTLNDMVAKLKEFGKCVKFVSERNVFRFGNSDVMETSRSVLIPIQLGNKPVVVRAAVLTEKGENTSSS